MFFEKYLQKNTLAKYFSEKRWGRSPIAARRASVRSQPSVDIKERQAQWAQSRKQQRDQFKV